jgi:cell division protein FtsN
MAKDYKNRIPAYRRQRQRDATRYWGIAGAAAAGIAGLVGLAMYFFSAPEGTPAPPPEEASAEAVAAEAPAAQPGKGRKSASRDKKIPPEGDTAVYPVPSSPPEPRFSFYKILPEKEVIVAENEIKAMKREESQGKKPAAAYLLQAGSFASQQEAEKLKARLAELKVKARLEMIKLDNTAWYRVKIGPYATLADADKVRQYLRGNKIDSIVQKAAE